MREIGKDVNIWSEPVVEKAASGWGHWRHSWTRYSFEQANDGSLLCDIGCGFGRFYNWLTKHRKTPCDYVGVDGSEWMIRKCKQLYGTSEDHVFFVHDAVEPFDFINEAWKSTILCNSVLIHLPFSHQDAVLKNIYDAAPRKAVFDIESKDGVTELSRIGKEMDENFFRTWNDREKFLKKVLELFKDYDVTVSSFPYGGKLARHVFVASSI